MLLPVPDSMYPWVMMILMAFSPSPVEFYASTAELITESRPGPVRSMSPRIHGECTRVGQSRYARSGGSHVDDPHRAPRGEHRGPRAGAHAHCSPAPLRTTYRLPRQPSSTLKAAPRDDWL